VGTKSSRERKIHHKRDLLEKVTLASCARDNFLPQKDAIAATERASLKVLRFYLFASIAIKTDKG
jgi:hypothetical protein